MHKKQITVPGTLGRPTRWQEYPRRAQKPGAGGIQGDSRKISIRKALVRGREP